MLTAATSLSLLAAPQVAKKLTSPHGNNMLRYDVKAEQPSSGTSEQIRKLEMLPRTRSVSQNLFSHRITSGFLSIPRQGTLSVAGDVPVINGLVTFADNWDSSGAEVGLYHIPTADGMQFDKIFDISDISYSAATDGEIYAGFNFVDYGFFAYFSYSAYDLDTGEKLCSVEVEDPNELPIDITFDSTNGKYYGLTLNDKGNGYVLAEFKLTDSGYQRTVMGPLEGKWNAIASNADGQLYAINGYGRLYKLNKETAQATLIGNTGYRSDYLTSAAFDSQTGRLFWSVCTESQAFIAEVNTETAETTILYNFPNRQEVVGMYVPAPAAADNAPAAVSNLSAHYERGSFDGNITFTMPSTLFDGTPASGQAGYHLYVNGVKQLDGTANYGDNVEQPWVPAVAEPGYYEFKVVPFNENGDGAKNKIKVFLGTGVPESPANVSASYNQTTQKMSVSWDAVSTSTDGGYIDPVQVVYTVTDNYGNVVAESTHDTSIEIPVPDSEELKFYKYSVTASYNGKSSGAVKSDAVMLGVAFPPYSQDFSKDWDGWSVIDANGDGNTWNWSDFDDGNMQCQFNSTLNMDDWLFSVPVKLKKGMIYVVSFEAEGNSSFPEKIEVKYGKTATADGMTTPVMEATEVAGRCPYSVTISPDEDGVYYFGFHGCSDPDRYYLKVDNFAISAPMATTAPAAVENLTAAPGEYGAKYITLNFDTPKKDIAGNPISSVSKIEILRGDDVVKTINNPAVGSAQSFTDNLEAAGTYQYTVIASNANGRGMHASVSAFCGLDIPAAPANVKITETSNPGEVTISWDPVTEDVRGMRMKPEMVQYYAAVYDKGWQPLSDPVSEPSYTFRAVPAGQQAFVEFGAFAVNEAGSSRAGFSDLEPVGTAYDGLFESFRDTGIHYIWKVDTEGGAQWSINNDEKIVGMLSFDNDNGYLVCQGTYSDTFADYYSGKVNLKNLSIPALTFYTFNIDGDEPDYNEIKVYIKSGDNEFSEVFAKTIAQIAGENAPGGWYKVTVPLTEFAGKEIQFAIRSVIKQYSFSFIDAIKVDNILDNDLKAGNISAPSVVTAGSGYDIDLTVINEGMQSAGDYTIDIIADGEVVNTVNGESIEPLSSKTFTVKQTMSPLATEPVGFTAKINYAPDQNTANNTFNTFEVTPIASNLPKVNDLTASKTQDGVKLTWSRPDLSNAAPKAVTADFEDGDPFMFEYKDWTFVDRDGKPMGGIKDTELPNITPGTTPGNFFVFDNTIESIAGDDSAESFAAHSGNKYLASMYNMNGESVDDWAISPELYDGGQIISLYMRSYVFDYAEKVRFCYSTGSADPEDFVEIKTVEKVPGSWTLYQIELPAGAKRFAINSVAKDAFMLMVDDVTYIPAEGERNDLNIIGYNIYRNGELINAQPVADCSYVDTVPATGELKYAVSVVYDQGMSGASNIVTVDMVGINDIFECKQVTTSHNLIKVTADDGALVSIYSTDGKTIYSGKGNANVNVPAGIYIVRIDDKFMKLMVD